MDKESAEEFTASLRQSIAGTTESFIGQLRMIALGVKLGVPKSVGMRNEAWCDEVMPQRQIPFVLQRREFVRELSEEEGMSNRQIADVIGVAEMTVRRDKAATNVAPEGEEPIPPRHIPDETATNVAPRTPPDLAKQLKNEQRARAAAEKKLATLSDKLNTTEENRRTLKESLATTSKEATRIEKERKALEGKNRDLERSVSDAARLSVLNELAAAIHIEANGDQQHKPLTLASIDAMLRRLDTRVTVENSPETVTMEAALAVGEALQKTFTATGKQRMGSRVYGRQLLAPMTVIQSEVIELRKRDPQELLDAWTDTDQVGDLIEVLQGAHSALGAYIDALIGARSVSLRVVK